MDNGKIDFDDIKVLFSKAWYKSKTIIANGGIAIFGILFSILEQLGDSTNEILLYLKGIDSKYWLLAISVIALLNVINRKYTNKSIK